MDSGTNWAWTTGRTIIPFVSLDRYGPKEMFTYLDHELEPHRRFPHAAQTPTRNSQKMQKIMIFLKISWSRYVNISLEPYLSEDTNGMIVRPIVQAQMVPESISSLKICGVYWPDRSLLRSTTFGSELQLRQHCSFIGIRMVESSLQDRSAGHCSRSLPSSGDASPRVHRVKQQRCFCIPAREMG